jgi:hypothetical protein
MKRNEARLKTIEKKAFPAGNGLQEVPPILYISIASDDGGMGEPYAAWDSRTKESYYVVKRNGKYEKKQCAIKSN